MTMTRDHYVESAKRFRTAADAAVSLDERDHCLRLLDAAVQDLASIDCPNRDAYGALTAIGVIAIAALVAWASL